MAICQTLDMDDMRFRGFFSVNLIFEILRSYMLLILPSFLYFDKGRRSYPRASCLHIRKLLFWRRIAIMFFQSDRILEFLRFVFPWILTAFANPLNLEYAPNFSGKWSSVETLDKFRLKRAPPPHNLHLSYQTALLTSLSIWIDEGSNVRVALSVSRP